MLLWGSITLACSQFHGSLESVLKCWSHKLYFDIQVWGEGRGVNSKFGGGSTVSRGVHGQVGMRKGIRLNPSNSSGSATVFQ